MNDTNGKSLIAAGIIIVILGLLFLYKDSILFIRFIGKLPGDISIKRDSYSFSFPIVTCIMISIIISLVLYIIGKLK